MFISNEEYVYLNNFINVFRQRLRNPDMTIGYLASLLKRYDEFSARKDPATGAYIVNQKFRNFIRMYNGKPVYHKKTLYRILGCDSMGLSLSKSADFSELNALKQIMANDAGRQTHRNFAPWAEDEIELPAYSKEYENPASDPDRISDLMTNYMNQNESKRNVFITESQLDILKEAYFVEREKVRVVREFLDKHCIKGAHPTMSEDGEPIVIGIVALIIPGGEPKPMTDKQLFYYLQNHFKNLFADKKKRDAFLKMIIKKWYYDEIDKYNTVKGHNKYSE